MSIQMNSKGKSCHTAVPSSFIDKELSTTVEEIRLLLTDALL
jgi:hypothetical protein